MDRTAWTDERLDDAFVQLRAEMRDGFRDLRAENRSIRGELAQIKLFMLGGLITILTAIAALPG